MPKNTSQEKGDRNIGGKQSSVGGRKGRSKKTKVRNYLKDSVYGLSDEELRLAGVEDETDEGNMIAKDNPYRLKEEELHPAGKKEEEPLYVELPMDEELLEETQMDFEEEEALEKPDGPVVAENAFPDKRKKHRRWYGAPLGVLILCLALVGTIFLGTKVYTFIYEKVTDDSEERNYDNFLTPVVLLDPQPFETLDGADKNMILEASIWRVMFSHMEDADLSYDENARVIFPESLVNQSAEELFGPNCVLTPADINLQQDSSAAQNDEAGESDATTIHYDEETGSYHVPVVPIVGSYIPYTESIKKDGNKKYLRVAYRIQIADNSGGGAFITSSNSSEETYHTVKYMEYELTYDDTLNTEYISAIRSLEEGE